MRHVVLGGGVAAVSAAEELCRLAPPGDEVALVAPSAALKSVAGVARLSPRVEELAVAGADARALAAARRNLRFVRGWAARVDLSRREVAVVTTRRRRGTRRRGDGSGEQEDGGQEEEDGQKEHEQEEQEEHEEHEEHEEEEEVLVVVPYDRLCVCAGARPRLVARHPRVVALRDTESAEDLAARLRGARRVAVVGNGGIALGLVGEARGPEVVWVLRHGHIGDAFFDADAAGFLLRELEWRREARIAERPEEREEEEERQAVDAAEKQQESQRQGQDGAAAGPSGRGGGERRPVEPRARLGAALGPKWADALPCGEPARVTIERHAEVLGVFDSRAEAEATLRAAGAAPAARPCAGHDGDDADWPAWLALADAGGGGAAAAPGRALGADLVVSATGVEPATDWLPPELERAADGGLAVDAGMRTSDPHVWAAGDCCTLRPGAGGPHFFQMRLWTQARLTGAHAARCMLGRGDEGDFALELFTHATRFLGKRVVLLGLYNGQRLEREPAGDIATYSRALDAGTPASTFVRVLLVRGRVRGAVLVGDTGLEEALENLVLDGLDVGAIGPALLDPDVDLDHIFD